MFFFYFVFNYLAYKSKRLKSVSAFGLPACSYPQLQNQLSCSFIANDVTMHAWKLTVLVFEKIFHAGHCMLSDTLRSCMNRNLLTGVIEKQLTLLKTIKIFKNEAHWLKNLSIGKHYLITVVQYFNFITAVITVFRVNKNIT